MAVPVALIRCQNCGTPTRQSVLVERARANQCRLRLQFAGLSLVGVGIITLAFVLW